MIVKNKVLLFLIGSLFFSTTAPAQIHLLRNYELGRSIASKSGRLMVMDFWASWCRPCKDMDVELWQNPETQKFATYFVGVRVNAEIEHSLVKKYRANSLPKVVITTVNGDIIWEREGYDEARTFIRVFEALPPSVDELNKHLLILATNKNDPEANYSAGIEFQRLGKTNNNKQLKNAFLKNSEIYLRRASQFSTDSLLNEQIELMSIANKELLDHIDN